MPKASQRSRRNFLKQVGVGILGASSTSLLGACSSVVKIIENEHHDYTKKVVILGGGLAGLMAARELKKTGVPFRLFEGSSRLGGRCYTIQDFNAASQSAELGAEFIEEDHDDVLRVCHEMRIETVKIPDPLSNLVFFTGENHLSGPKLIAFLNDLDRKLRVVKEKLNDQQWDSISLLELMENLGSFRDPRMALWLRRVCHLLWGCEPNQLSAFAYFHRMGRSLSGQEVLTSRRIRIRGGAEVLAQALNDRVSGVIPGQFVVSGFKLVEIEARGDEVNLLFDTPTGQINIVGNVIICTLPFSVLRNIKGISSLNFSPQKHQAITQLGYGTHGRFIASYEQSFWQKKGHSFTGEIQSHWITESSFVQNMGVSIPRGILSTTTGGHSGMEIGLHFKKEFETDLEKLGFPNKTSEIDQIFNWSQSPWAKGSISHFQPGQVYGFSSGVATSERLGTFIFAGEHCSIQSGGTMNGALESGIRAAQEALKFKSIYKA